MSCQFLMADLPVTDRENVARSVACTHKHHKERIRAKIQHSASSGGWIGNVSGQGTYTLHIDT